MKYSLIIMLFLVIPFLTVIAESKVVTPIVKNPQITFVELGSTTCIPCKQMVPVMKTIETKYKDIVQVTFYDVGKHKDMVDKYQIRLIPTQVFLDKNGKEFFRHEGFYPAKEITKLIDKKLKEQKNK